MNAATFTFETVHGVKQSFCLGLTPSRDKNPSRENRKALPHSGKTGGLPDSEGPENLCPVNSVNS